MKKKKFENLIKKEDYLNYPFNYRFILLPEDTTPYNFGSFNGVAVRNIQNIDAKHFPFYKPISRI